MTKLHTFLGALTLVCLFPALSHAQFELGLQGGRNFMGGDAYCWRHAANQSLRAIPNTGSASGIYARYLFDDRRFGARFQYAFIPLTFDERLLANASHTSRGFKGSNKASDLSVDLAWNLWRHDRVSPYLFGGIGVQLAKYEINWGNEAGNPNISTLIEQDKNASKVNLIVPVGGGLRIRLFDQINATLEAGMRLPVSDYYDGISKAANPNANDWYGYGMVGLNFLLRGAPDRDHDGISDKKDACPDVAGLKALNGCPDADGDGITDGEDRCPDVAGKAIYRGCPDTDEDGIADVDDKCPNVKGVAALMGCPDADGDGVADADDACPDQKGVIALQGCPDRDGDGVADKADDCPDQAGSIKLMGCPDQDNDGIADKNDKCPTEAGLASNNGCPIADADKDGIADAVDKCPSIAGTVANQGCPASMIINSGVMNSTMTTNSTIVTKSATMNGISGLTNSSSTSNEATGVTKSTTNQGVDVTKSSINEAAGAATKSATMNGISGLTNSSSTSNENSGVTQSASPTPNSTTTTPISENSITAPAFPESTIKSAPPAVAAPAPVSAAPIVSTPAVSVSTPAPPVVAAPAPVVVPNDVHIKGGEHLQTTVAQSTPTCAACATGTDPIFTSVCENPKKLSRLGSNPEFGNSHSLSPEGFYEKLKKAYAKNAVDKVFLDRIYKAMGYTGFEQASAEQFSAVTLPVGTTGKLGYSTAHKTGCYTLPDDEYHRLAFRIVAANGCDIHFMKTCGNHFFFCQN
jgi:hypothetical protein